LEFFANVDVICQNSLNKVDESLCRFGIREFLAGREVDIFSDVREEVIK
jgi:hypothetical protein